MTRSLAALLAVSVALAPATVLAQDATPPDQDGVTFVSSAPVPDDPDAVPQATPDAGAAPDVSGPQMRRLAIDRLTADFSTGKPEGDLQVSIENGKYRLERSKDADRFYHLSFQAEADRTTYRMALAFDVNTNEAPATGYDVVLVLVDRSPEIPREKLGRRLLNRYLQAHDQLSLPEKQELVRLCVPSMIVTVNGSYCALAAPAGGTTFARHEVSVGALVKPGRNVIELTLESLGSGLMAQYHLQQAEVRAFSVDKGLLARKTEAVNVLDASAEAPAFSSQPADMAAVQASPLRETHDARPTIDLLREVEYLHFSATELRNSRPGAAEVARMRENLKVLDHDLRVVLGKKHLVKTDGTDSLLRFARWSILAAREYFPKDYPADGLTMEDARD